MIDKSVVYKWCKPEHDGPLHSPAPEGQWIRSHIKFLRSGDFFKVEDAGEFMATSDPFWNEAHKCMDIGMVRK